MYFCPIISDAPYGDILITILLVFTCVFFVLKAISSSLAGSPFGNLLYEFYGKNPTHSYLIDLLFMLSYFTVTLAITRSSLVQNSGFLVPTFRFLIILAVVIVVLNMVIKMIIDSTAASSPNATYLQFFKRWANAMGFRAMVWDWFYLGLVAMVAIGLMYFKVHTWIWLVAAFWLFVTWYFLTIEEA